MYSTRTRVPWIDVFTSLSCCFISVRNADKQAIDAGVAALLTKLHIRKEGAKGNVNRVVAMVQSDVKKLFEQQKKAKKVSCPVCGDVKVSKALMAPAQACSLTAIETPSSDRSATTSVVP